MNFSSNVGRTFRQPSTFGNAFQKNMSSTSTISGKTFTFPVANDVQINKIPVIRNIFRSMVENRQMISDNKEAFKNLSNKEFFLPVKDTHKLEEGINHLVDLVHNAIEETKNDDKFISNENLMNLAESRGKGDEFKELLGQADNLKTRKDCSEWINKFYECTGKDVAKTTGAGLKTAVDLSVVGEGMGLLKPRPQEALAMTIQALVGSESLGMLLLKSPEAHLNLQKVETTMHRLVHDLAELEFRSSEADSALPSRAPVERYDIPAQVLASRSVEARTFLASTAATNLGSTVSSAFLDAYNNVTNYFQVSEAVDNVSERLNAAIDAGKAKPNYA